MTTVPPTTDRRPVSDVNRVVLYLAPPPGTTHRRAGWAVGAPSVHVPLLPARRRAVLDRLITAPGTWMRLTEIAEQLRDHHRYGTPAYSVLTRLLAVTRDMAALMAGAMLDGAALATEQQDQSA